MSLWYGWVRLVGLLAAAELVVGLACRNWLASGDPVLLGRALALGLIVGLLVVGLEIGSMPGRIRRDRGQGRQLRAAKGLEFLEQIAPRRSWKAVFRLQRASCYLAEGYLDAGGALLRQVDRALLPERLRPVWDANYAYYLLAAEGQASQALRILDESQEIWPQEMPASRAVRGLALAESGLLPEAATELTRVLERPDLTPAERSEVSFHLAGVWRKLGHEEYAREHLLRASAAGELCLYGRLARQELAQGS